MSLNLINAFKTCIPPLNSTIHKGSNGRIGVIGGSQDYTGAPYFAAISAFKAGADLVHVFCTQAAGPVIKSYSPELIVHPVLDTQNAVKEISEWVQRLHALVIGPGLGRDEGVLQTVKEIIERSPVIPMVLDADGLFLLVHFEDMNKALKQPVIFTPNAIEFQRLLDCPGIPPDGIYLKKGECDEIWELIGNVKEGCVKCDEQGSPRRCGGQGDVLSGTAGLFAAWVYMNRNIGVGYREAAFAASSLTRRCSKLAFAKYKRGMVASNLIEFIPDVFYDMLETNKN